MNKNTERVSLWTTAQEIHFLEDLGEHAEKCLASRLTLLRGYKEGVKYRAWKSDQVNLDQTEILAALDKMIQVEEDKQRGRRTGGY